MDGNPPHWISLQKLPRSLERKGHYSSLQAHKTDSVGHHRDHPLLLLQRHPQESVCDVFHVLLNSSELAPHSAEESSPLFPQEGAPPSSLPAVQGVSTNHVGGPVGCYPQSAKGGNGVTVCNLLLYPCKLTSASLIILLKSRILIVLPAEIVFGFEDVIYSPKRNKVLSLKILLLL